MVAVLVGSSRWRMGNESYQDAQLQDAKIAPSRLHVSDPTHCSHWSQKDPLSGTGYVSHHIIYFKKLAVRTTKQISKDRLVFIYF